MHLQWSDSFNITEEAADDIAAVILNNNNKLEVLNLGKNNFKTAGIVKIASALQNITSLITLKI